MRGYIPPTDDAERVFVRHIADLVKAVRASGKPRFSGFCSDREQVLATAALSGQAWEGYRFWGGFAEAERKVLGIYDESIDDTAFDVCALRAEAADGAGLTHRDYLGAVLSLGVKRASVGDILVQPAGATLFVQRAAALLLTQELRTVGRCTVRVQDAVPSEDTLVLPTRTEHTATLASPRLDALLAVMLHKGRAAAATHIKRGDVMVNHIAVSSAHYEVCEGDIITVRGAGKFQLTAFGGKSKKDRVFVTYLQY